MTSDLDKLREDLKAKRGEADAGTGRANRDLGHEHYDGTEAFEEPAWAKPLRYLGHATRFATYLTIGAVLWFGSYLLFEPKSLLDRPLGSITAGELLNNLMWVVLAGGGSILLVRGFFAEDDAGIEYVDWRAWGKFGLVLIGGALLFLFFVDR